MNQKELIIEYRKRKKMLEIWGLHIKNIVVNHFNTTNSELIVFTNGPRVKEDGSFIEKALFRNKPYRDPLIEISDQVGIRFIVSLLSNITLIKDFITTSDKWNSICDRDFVREVNSKPEYFDYQSVHIVIWPKENTVIEGEIIDETYKCEIQIRSLLQHAYAEISHNLIYKKSIEKLDNRLNRKMYRSIALMEVVDDYFVETNECIRSETKLYELIDRVSKQICNSNQIDYIVVQKLNSRLINFIEVIVGEMLDNEFMNLSVSTDNLVIAKKIISRDDSYLYQQPAMVLIIELVDQFPTVISDKWPFNRQYLEIIYSMMGHST